MSEPAGKVTAKHVHARLRKAAEHHGRIRHDAAQKAAAHYRPEAPPPTEPAK